ncbi:hypothetical protein Tco_0130863 [Tanacetum coccineum]
MKFTLYGILTKDLHTAYPFLNTPYPLSEQNYINVDIADFEIRLAKIYMREGQSMFTSRAWRRLSKIRGSLVHKLILKFFSTFRFGEAVLVLDTAEALQCQLGGARRRMSLREFILAMGLHTVKEIKSVESARQIPDKGV